MLSLNSNSKEYAVSVNTDDISQAIREVSDALYNLAQETLATHGCQQEDDCPFLIFARDILGVLDQHTDQLSCEARPSKGEDEDHTEIHI